jgi:hypothetical protein
MKNTFDRLTKPWKLLVAGISFIAVLIPCWQFYKSSTTHKIAGGWRIKFNIVSSAYKPYVGETHVQKIFFTQNDCEISGNGEKIEYNGKPLKSDMHRQIEYKGAIDDDFLKATYVLHGLLRPSSGVIEVTLTDGGKKMAGSFSGTAGDCKGTVEGEMVD